MRLYNPLFTRPDPGADGDFTKDLNPLSLEILPDAKVEPALGEAREGEAIQFERQGYFCLDAGEARNRPRVQPHRLFARFEMTAKATTMNGAESLVRTLLASGVDTCFANPGTSEMHFVAALDRAPGMRCVLGLFEGVVTGAADGYGRMTGKPAATLMHCGPGFANGLAYLHNAKRAQTPIVNIVGDQATYHAPLNPPLASDVEGFARPVSQWVRKVMHTQTLGADAAEAVQGAYRPPGGIATLILPSDVSWNEGGTPGTPLPIPAPAKVSSDAVAEAARALRLREPAVIMLSGAALQADSLATAHSIAMATGARIMAPTFNARIARGPGGLCSTSCPIRSTKRSRS